MNYGKWLRTILYILVGIWLLRFPPTRALILWMLPLGSGWDDAFQIVGIVVIVVILLTKNVKFGAPIRKRWRAVAEFFADPNTQGDTPEGEQDDTQE